MTDTITSRQGDTVASLCHRHYGYTRGVVEKVLEANVTLPRLNCVLPAGTVVIMPVPESPAPKATVKLWE
jgi:phage tail protein X